MFPVNPIPAHVLDLLPPAFWQIMESIEQADAWQAAALSAEEMCRAAEELARVARESAEADPKGVVTRYVWTYPRNPIQPRRRGPALSPGGGVMPRARGRSPP